ncbi:hypothetical protein [Lysinibacillus parviboronicapiens]|nr:hypothetical protein [Lysinibacillus parviboronicapiens]
MPMKSVRRSGNQRVHLDTSILKEKAISLLQRNRFNKEDAGCMSYQSL